MKKILLFLILLMPIVLAIPPQPDVLHQFYGDVVCDGTNLESGTLKAVLGSEEFTTSVVNGKYGYQTSFFVSRQEGNTETNIKFYIDDYEVASYTYQAEGYTELDLITNIASCTTQDFDVSDDDSNGGDDDDDDSSSNKDKSQHIVIAPDTSQQVSSGIKDEDKQDDSLIIKIYRGNKNLKYGAVGLIVLLLCLFFIWVLKRKV